MVNGIAVVPEANRAIYLKYPALPVLLHHEPDHTARFFRRNHAQRVLGELTFVMQQVDR
jgi:hypothetical protein